MEGELHFHLPMESQPGPELELENAVPRDCAEADMADNLQEVPN